MVDHVTCNWYATNYYLTQSLFGSSHRRENCPRWAVAPGVASLIEQLLLQISHITPVAPHTVRRCLGPRDPWSGSPPGSCSSKATPGDGTVRWVNRSGCGEWHDLDLELQTLARGPDRVHPGRLGPYILLDYELPGHWQHRHEPVALHRFAPTPMQPEVQPRRRKTCVYEHGHV